MSATASTSSEPAFPRTRGATALAAFWKQAALLSVLLEEVARLAPPDAVPDEAVSEELVELLARVGCRSLEAASELTRALENSRRSP